MTTQIITVRGEIQWAKVFPENRDMFEYNEETKAFDKPSSTDGKYSVNVALDMEEFRKLKRSGSMSCKHSKENEVGLDVVKLSRPHVKRGAGGKVLEWAGGPPKVVDVNDEPWDFDTDGFIGNGSDVEVTVAVYTTAFSPGTRLEKIKVITNVPIEPVVGAPEAEPTKEEINF